MNPWPYINVIAFVAVILIGLLSGLQAAGWFPFN